MHFKTDSNTMRQIIEKYSPNPKIVYLIGAEKDVQFTLIAGKWSQKTHLCQFCSCEIERPFFKNEDASDAFVKNCEIIRKNYGGIVVQEICGEPTWVKWLHYQSYLIVPKRIWMLSIRDGNFFTVTAKQCKERHETDPENFQTIPSEPLLQYVDSEGVVEFIKIHESHLSEKIITG